MGILSDDELEFEDHHSDVETPPGSPTMRAVHAQAIADIFSTPSSEFNTRAAREYAVLCCEEFGLTDTDKDDVLKTSQMNIHLVMTRLYTRMVSLTRATQKMAVESFLSSPEFKDHITRRIQATFLDYDLPSYVCGSTSRLIQHMQENPGSWRIPAVIHANFVNSKVYWKAVGAIASNFRGDMRRKIKRSIIDKLDIGALAKKLCVKGYQPTRDHWRRFALLRMYMLDWEKLPIRRGEGRPLSFWAFIDSKLDKLREVCTRSTSTETQAMMKEKLKANLKLDEQRFMGPSTGKTQLPARIIVPQWQKDHSQAVIRMATYVVDASPDDDIEDDEGSSNANGGAQSSAAADAAAEGGEQRGGDGGDDGDDEEDEDGAGPSRGSVPSGAANVVAREANPGAELAAGSRTSHTRTNVANPQEFPAGTQGEVRSPPIPRVLVPDTQEGMLRTQPANDLGSSSSSIPPFVPETPRSTQEQQLQATNPANRSSPGLVPQSSWAGGSLVDRRLPTSHRAPSPIANANKPPPSARKLRTRPH